nr:SRPBCC family protein [Sphingomonas sp. Y57]
MTDSIQRTVDLRAPIERVWRALTDHREFGQWFRVAIDQPFATGEPATGHITLEGYEHVRWNVRIVAMDEPHRFAFTWHPYAIDPAIDYSAEEPTLVDFRLEPVGEGTRVTVTESGFDRIPADRRDEAIRMNSGGWTAQVENIRSYLDG